MRDHLWIVFRLGEQPQVLKSRAEVGKLPFKLRLFSCANSRSVTNRFVAEDSTSVYYVDDTCNLVRHRWSDIQEDRFDVYQIVCQFVHDVKVGKLGLVVLSTNGRLFLPKNVEVDLKSKIGAETWSVIEAVGSRTVEQCAEEHSTT